MLRPFFSPKNDDPRDLALENWVVDLKSTNFPGSQPGRGTVSFAFPSAPEKGNADRYASLARSTGQELTSATHPHLRLDETMASVPAVRPVCLPITPNLLCPRLDR